MIGIREEISEDIEAIRRVNEQAFGQPAEANIVNKLRQNCLDLLYLVAIQEGRVVGHILFSPVQIEGETIVEGMGLAPNIPKPCMPKLENHPLTGMRSKTEFLLSDLQRHAVLFLQEHKKHWIILENSNLNRLNIPAIRKVK